MYIPLSFLHLLRCIWSIAIAFALEYPLLTNQRAGKAVSKTRNLCAQIPEELHAKVREEQERLGKTLSEYVGEILEQYFEQQKGGKTMSGNSRTLAFQARGISGWTCSRELSGLDSQPSIHSLRQTRRQGFISRE